MASETVQPSDNERLLRLFDDLNANGFQITANERIRVTSLLLGLQVSDAMPPEPHRLGNMIGSVVCHSAEEQQTFRRIFNFWFTPSPDSVTPKGFNSRFPSTDTEGGRSSVSVVIRRQWAALKRQLRALLPLFLVIFILAVALQIYIAQYLLPPSPPQPEEMQPTQKSLSQPGPSKQTPPEPLTPEGPGPIPPPGVAPPRVAPSQPPLIGERFVGLSKLFTAVERSFGPASVLMLMIPLGIIAFLIIWSKRLISAYARQPQVQATDVFRTLLSQDEGHINFIGEDFFHNVQPMRRQLQSASDQIDVERTIEATARAAGYVSPIYTTRSTSPEYVILIDRRHIADHLAQYYRTLTNALEHAGIHIVVYYFDLDPRRLTLGPGHPLLDLDDIAILQHSHRLILFIDAANLLDMTTGYVKSWAVAFTEWSQVILLTPKDLADWSRVEWLVEAELGIQVLPATEEGLKIAAQLFDLEHELALSLPEQRPHVLMLDPRCLNSIFAMSDWRWVDDITPPLDEVDHLIQQLHTELQEAFNWLSALAVYPGIYWSLTLFLGSNLTSDSGAPLFTGENMLKIARLPWLTHGRMPDWFRERLILEMSDAHREKVRKVLDELLLTVMSRGQSHFTIVISLPSDEQTRRVLDQVNSEERRQDTILIDFMTRREASTTDLRIHQKVAKALGLSQFHTTLPNIFGNRRIKAFHAEGDRLQQWIVENPIADYGSRAWHDIDGYGPEVYQIITYVKPTGDHVTFHSPMYLLKRNPNQSSVILLDEGSLNFLVHRKRLTFRYSALGMILLGIFLSFRYSSVFDTFDSLGLAILMIAGIIYAPCLISWFLLLRPCVKSLKRFPELSDQRFRGIE